METTSSGRPRVSLKIEALNCANLLMISFLFTDVTDDSEPESGSGDGREDDDEDDSGSGKLNRKVSSDCVANFISISAGFNQYPESDEDESPSPPHIDHGTRRPIPEIHNGIDTDHSTDDPDITEPKSHSGSESSTRETWRAKRLILTYFVPIVMAWFGGSISGAVADLL